jgi:hypothetical protein
MGIVGGKGCELQRRRERKNEFGLERQKKFLSVFANSGNITASAQEVGVALSTIWTRRQDDDQFREAFKQAQDNAISLLRAELVRRGIEANNGGDMVLQVLGQADFHLPARKVHATHGKGARAEPIAMLFENGKAGLAGCFAELEQELCHLTTGGYEGPGSPDRADAMVWALHELSGGRKAAPKLRGL